MINSHPLGVKSDILGDTLKRGDLYGALRVEIPATELVSLSRERIVQGVDSPLHKVLEVGRIILCAIEHVGDLYSVGVACTTFYAVCAAVIGVRNRIDVIGAIAVLTSAALILGVALLAAGGINFIRNVVVTNGCYLGIFIRIITSLTRMLGISFIGTRGSDDDVVIIVTESHGNIVNADVAAGGAGIGGVSISGTGSGGNNLLFVMSLCGLYLILIAIGAILTGIHGVSMRCTGRLNHACGHIRVTERGSRAGNGADVTSVTVTRGASFLGTGRLYDHLIVVVTELSYDVVLLISVGIVASYAEVVRVACCCTGRLLHDSLILVTESISANVGAILTLLRLGTSSGDDSMSESGEHLSAGSAVLGIVTIRAFHGGVSERADKHFITHGTYLIGSTTCRSAGGMGNHIDSALLYQYFAAHGALLSICKTRLATGSGSTGNLHTLVTQSGNFILSNYNFSAIGALNTCGKTRIDTIGSYGWDSRVSMSLSGNNRLSNESNATSATVRALGKTRARTLGSLGSIYDHVVTESGSARHGVGISARGAGIGDRTVSGTGGIGAHAAVAVTRRRNFNLLCQNYLTIAAVRALGKTGSSTGRLYLGICHRLVSLGRCRIALVLVGASLTLVQGVTGLGTGRIDQSQHVLVPEWVNLLTDVLVTAAASEGGEAAFGTGRRGNFLLI